VRAFHYCRAQAHRRAARPLEPLEARVLERNTWGHFLRRAAYLFSTDCFYLDLMIFTL
jgi:hypothetical protein